MEKLSVFVQVIYYFLYLVHCGTVGRLAVKCVGLGVDGRDCAYFGAKCCQLCYLGQDFWDVI